HPTLPFPPSRLLRDLHSFPTRRSSDLERIRRRHERHRHLFYEGAEPTCKLLHAILLRPHVPQDDQRLLPSRRHRVGHVLHRLPLDRKSTRLNSSHGSISYAVFCLKKKN